MTPEQFKTMRLQLGLSQEQMAKKLGFSNKSSICHYEKGRRKVSKQVVLLLKGVKKR